ncbi:MAG TPA: relaxase/mobilization nuclease domain-containing protein, partial [Desulfosporosinus sp.]|nr:relaxase/mobilization nuclease domain-containing protein [Desulfosporosinus sp.]
TEEVLISGKDCDAQQVLEEMQTTKELYGKTQGRQYKHFVQSFSPDDQLDPSRAHQIGFEMAQKAFLGYEVLVATHTDKDHLHNHFIVNSVNFETGAKYRQSISELMDIKELSNEICEREGLHVMKKEEQTPGKSLSMNEYQVAVKGESWKFKLMGEIDQSRETSQSKKGFIKSMESKGYHVKWTDERKSITYSTPEGHKVRDNKLHDPNYLKEAMEHGFRKTQELKLQHERTRSIDELSLNGAGIENEGIASGTDDHEQPVHRGQSRPDQETRGERAGTEIPNQATGRTRLDHIQETGRATTTELSEAGEGFRDHQRGSEKEPRNQQQNNSRGHGASAPGENYSQPELEGKDEAIRDTTSDNSRTSDRNSRSVQTSDSLNDAIEALGSSFEKFRQEEKLKAELMKEKLEMIASQKEEKAELMKEKLEMKASQKTRSKGRDWGPEL